MAVIHEKAVGGVQGRSVGGYLVVGVLAVVLGIGLALGFQAITTDEPFRPAEIEQARSEALVSYLQSQWIAEVNATKNADLVEFYRAPFMARVARIQEQRAADMVAHFSAAYRGELAAINEQRARDMVEFRYGEGR